MKLVILVSESTKNLHPDDHLLPAAFSAMGINCVTKVWTDFSPETTENVLFRTVWDYTGKSSQFCDLIHSLDRTESKVVNPISTIQWNMNKTYLLELQSLGYPVPATEAVEIFDSTGNLKSEGTWVYKPAVGASGLDTFLSNASDFPTKVKALDGRKVLIQEFVPEILTSGEISMMYFGGIFSHAVVKTPKSGEFRIHEEHGGTTRPFDPPKNLLNQAQELVDRLPVKQHYCRLDLVLTPGGPVVMEVELIEPSFYFQTASEAAVKLFCQSVAAPLKH